MKIGCSTVVFREYELEKVLAAISEIGYKYIETQATNPWCNHVIVAKDDPIRFREKVHAAGIQGVTALWTMDGALIPAENCIESVKRSIEWAAAAGIPVVNCGDGHKPTDMSEAEAFDRLQDRVLQLVEVAEKNKVKLAIEPHGTFSLTLAGLKRILGISDSQYIGINYDCANVHRASYMETHDDSSKWIHTPNQENEADVLKGIIDRVIHFHAKDLNGQRKCVALGTGEVLVKDCIDALKDVGYNGVVSLETEGAIPFDDTVALAAASYRFLKENIDET